jgi:AcrR family transcriptional regulator/DNA-binding MarR family transcriptional regulator
MAGTGNALFTVAAPAELPRLNGPAREQVCDIQRARILSAMAAVVRERGVARATVARVVAYAGVSRRTFYELFSDRDECFLATFDDGVLRASRYVLDAYDPEALWVERIRTSLAALLSFLDVERGVGWLLVVDSLGAGPVALERRRRVLARIVAFVDEGRGDGRGGDGRSPLTAEGVVGGIFSLIHARMVDDGKAPLMDLLNPLVAMIVLPYLGTAAARRELARTLPRVFDYGHRTGHDPLRELDMRLTYRTIRVLLAIDAHPGASNRQVGDAAGIRDQGQVSKLLARLQHLGLIRNEGNPKVKGEPNTWALTKGGEQVRAAITPGPGGGEHAGSLSARA